MWKQWRSEQEDELQGNRLFKECDISDNPWNQYWESQRAGDRSWDFKDEDGCPLWMTKEYKMVMSWDDSGAQEARETKQNWLKGMFSEQPDFSPDKYNDSIDWDVDVNWSSEAMEAWKYLAAYKPDSRAKRRRGGGPKPYMRNDDNTWNHHKRSSFHQPSAPLATGWSPPREKSEKSLAAWPQPSPWSPSREESPAAWPQTSTWSPPPREEGTAAWPPSPPHGDEPPPSRWSSPRDEEAQTREREAAAWCQRSGRSGEGLRPAWSPQGEAQPRWPPSRGRYNSSHRPTKNEQQQQDQQRQRQTHGRWTNRQYRSSQADSQQPKSRYVWRPKQV